MGSEQRNALVAVVLSGVILFGWQYYFAQPQTPATAPIEPTVTTTEQTAPVAASDKTADGPIEAVAAETFTVSGLGVAVTFDSTLSVTNVENPQAAFTFENTVD